jgi:hypothetical protein
MLIPDEVDIDRLRGSVCFCTDFGSSDRKFNPMIGFPDQPEEYTKQNKSGINLERIFANSLHHCSCTNQPMVSSHIKDLFLASIHVCTFGAQVPEILHRPLSSLLYFVPLSSSFLDETFFLQNFHLRRLRGILIIRMLGVDDLDRREGVSGMPTRSQAHVVLYYEQIGITTLAKITRTGTVSDNG